jgi:UDP-3-O-[3-hydroxymyristoyl] glucosamine N-acyltransferase
VKKSLHDIAAFLGGTVNGDDSVVIERIREIGEAGPGDITFIANEKYLKMLESTRASAVIVGPGVVCKGKNLVAVDLPYSSLGKLLEWYYPEKDETWGVHPEAHIEDGARVSPEASVYPGVFVATGARIDKGAVLYPGVFIGKDAVVGQDSVLYPGVTVYRRCLIGNRVILHAGVIIGADGFGFALPGSNNRKIPQVGYVQIDDDVEVGANSTVDRGALGRTWIQKGVKIDNLVQIAHNVVIGEYSVIAAQTGIAGSAQLGKGAVIGGQVGIVGHIKIGNGVMAAARAGITKNVPPGQIVAGAPHQPHRQWLKMEASLQKLPELRKTVANLMERLSALEEKQKKENI